MTKINGPAPNPCESCPYRRDVPSGVWAAKTYMTLIPYDAEPAFQPREGFQCHQTELGSDRARLCAGWVAVHGRNSLALKMEVSRGDVEGSVLGYTTSVPLFESGMEAAEHGIRDIENPSDEARALVAKIAAKRSDIGYR